MKNENNNSWFLWKVGKEIETCGDMSFYFITFSMKKFSLVVEEEKIFSKNNEGEMTSTHKNEHEIESIPSHASTYFSTSYPNQVLLFSFSMLLSNGDDWIEKRATKLGCEWTTKWG